MRAAFERDLAASTRITLEAWRSRAGHARGQGMVRSSVGVLAVTLLACRPRAAAPASPSSPFSSSLAPMAASAQDAATLRSTHAALQDKFASNQFGRPLVLESIQTSGDLRATSTPSSTTRTRSSAGAAVASTLVRHPDPAPQRQALPGQRRPAKLLNLSVGRKFDQPLEDAYELEFNYARGRRHAPTTCRCS